MTGLEVGISAPYGISGSVIHIPPKEGILNDPNRPGLWINNYHVVWKCGAVGARATLLNGLAPNDEWLLKVSGRCESCFQPEIVRLKREANKDVAKALGTGVLQRAMFCETCGRPDAPCKRGRELVAHHDDYNKPLAIRWLCRKCHIRWHQSHKAIPPRVRSAA